MALSQNSKLLVTLNAYKTQFKIWNIEYFSKDEKWAITRLFFIAKNKNEEKDCNLAKLSNDLISYFQPFIFSFL